MSKAKIEAEEKLYIVKTQDREIFCGWSTDPLADRITLRNARQAIYYSAETHGLLGLATTGPAKGSRIGPVAAIVECRRPDLVIECSSESATAWEKSRWE